MHIKKGDKVQVITGKDKGKQGEVLAVFRKENRVVVKGVNMIKKHQKPSNAMPNGGIIEREAKIDASNVMHIDPKTKKPTRVGYTYKQDKKGNEELGKNGKPIKVRYAKKSGEIID